MDRSISCSLLWSGCPTCRYKISTQVSQRSCSCSWGKKDVSFSLCLSERRSYRHVTMVVLLQTICIKKPCTYTWYINYAVIIIRARRPADLERRCLVCWYVSCDSFCRSRGRGKKKSSHVRSSSWMLGACQASEGGSEKTGHGAKLVRYVGWA